MTTEENNKKVSLFGDVLIHLRPRFCYDVGIPVLMTVGIATCLIIENTFGGWLMDLSFLTRAAIKMADSLVDVVLIIVGVRLGWFTMSLVNSILAWILDVNKMVSEQRKEEET